MKILERVVELLQKLLINKKFNGKHKWCKKFTGILFWETLRLTQVVVDVSAKTNPLKHGISKRESKRINRIEVPGTSRYPSSELGRYLIVVVPQLLELDHTRSCIYCCLTSKCSPLLYVWIRLAGWSHSYTKFGPFGLMSSHVKIVGIPALVYPVPWMTNICLLTSLVFFLVLGFLWFLCFSLPMTYIPDYSGLT